MPPLPLQGRRRSIPYLVCNTAGPQCLWEIHTAVQRSRKEVRPARRPARAVACGVVLSALTFISRAPQPAAVFLFDKKTVLNDKALTKQQKEDLLEVLRHGPQQVRIRPG